MEADYGWMETGFINLLYALHCPELDVIGVTTVTGGFTPSYSADCVLRLLELLGRKDIPVCPGFDRPLLHERDPYADRVWGKWSLENVALPLPEGPPANRPDPRHAVDLIGQTILENPGEVSLLFTGPLTNLAVALRRYPEMIKAVRQVVLFGGAYTLFPEGHGNITPTAEFNIWVDPDAAKMVMHSDLPLTTISINAGRRSTFSQSHFERVTASNSMVARLFKDSLGSAFTDSAPGSYIWNKNEVTNYLFMTELVTTYFLRPDLFQTANLHIEVDSIPGMGYGSTCGFESGEYVDGLDRFPLETNARIKTVAHDVDFEATAEMVINALAASAS